MLAFHYYGDSLPDWSSDGGAFDEGAKRFGRWLCKKGWVDDADVNVATGGTAGEEGRKGVQLVVEFATAYAITKALLPIRIAASVWATPWFARRILGPLGAGFRRMFRPKGR